MPLRPIVSLYFTNLPPFKHLVGILSPLVRNTSHTVRDSKEFVSFAQSVCLKNECLVSFDVISLFTRIPVDLALQIVHLRLENDVPLMTELHCQLMIAIAVPQCHLFSFRSVIYKQVYRTAMGSPVQLWWLTLSWNT